MRLSEARTASRRALCPQPAGRILSPAAIGAQPPGPRPRQQNRRPHRPKRWEACPRTSRKTSPKARRRVGLFAGLLDGAVSPAMSPSLHCPLLADIHRDPLDGLMAGLGFEMARYADDMVVLCRRQEEAGAAPEKLREWMAGAVARITNAGATATSRSSGSFAC